MNNKYFKSINIKPHFMILNVTTQSTQEHQRYIINPRMNRLLKLYKQLHRNNTICCPLTCIILREHAKPWLNLFTSVPITWKQESLAALDLF